MTKNVLITGASRGIGKACKQLLQKEGYKVIAPTRSELDLSDPDSVNTYLGKNTFKLYALINNAGINKPQWTEELDTSNFRDTLQVNLVAPILLTKAFVPKLKKNKISHIINISSMFGVIARGKQVPYVASKFALNGVTKSLALEFAKYNILVNSVCPGFVDTDLTRTNSKEKNLNLANEVPLGRFAKPKEVAKLVSFLISKDNTYITGANIMIDGGYSVK